MHWWKLRSVQQAGGAGALSPEEQALLERMQNAIAVLDPVERSAVERQNPGLSAEMASAADRVAARRRQRAELKLLPILIAAGWVQN